MTRSGKQVVFGLIFVVAATLLVFGIYRWSEPVPTCFDKIQNQQEEGVDCGKVCGNTCLQSLQPIRVLSSNLFKVSELNGQIDYDALFRVYNPNTHFGSANVEYSLRILNLNGDTISSILSKTGSFYILPGQTKYVYEPLLEVAKTSAGKDTVTLEITKIDWQKLEGVFDEDVKLVIRSKEFFADGKPGISARVTGTVFNSSDFDINRVDVIVALFKNNALIAANRTDIRTLIAGSDRFFEVDWFSPVSETPDRVDVEANTNVFQDSNFIRRYGTQEKFQQLY